MGPWGRYGRRLEKGGSSSSEKKWSIGSMGKTGGAAYLVVTPIVAFLSFHPNLVLLAAMASLALG